MKGWVAAVLCAAGWAATCVEARRRWAVDGKALEHAREGLAAGWEHCGDRSASMTIARAAQHVGAALEARS